MARLLIAACLFLPLAGCAGRHHASRAEQPVEQASLASASEPAPTTEPLAIDYEPAVARMLVFNLPEATYGPPLQLSRSGRQGAAYVGFDEGISEYFSVYTDDRQREDVRFDRFERRAVSVRTGVRYR